MKIEILLFSLSVVCLALCSACMTFPTHRLVTLQEVDAGEIISRDVKIPVGRGVWHLYTEPIPRNRVSEEDRQLWESMRLVMRIKNLSDETLRLTSMGFLVEDKNRDEPVDRTHYEFLLDPGEDANVFRGPLVRLFGASRAITIGAPRSERRDRDEFNVRVILEFETGGTFGSPVRIVFADMRT